MRSDRPMMKLAGPGSLVVLALSQLLRTKTSGSHTAEGLLRYRYLDSGWGGVTRKFPTESEPVYETALLPQK